MKKLFYSFIVAIACVAATVVDLIQAKAQMALR